jgi:hypothetical protein
VLGLTEHTHMLTQTEWVDLLSTADGFCQNGIFVALGAQEFGNLNDFGHFGIYDCLYRNPHSTENLVGSYQFMRTYGAIGQFHHPNPSYGTNFNDLYYYPDYADQMVAIEIRNGVRVDDYEPQYIEALQNGWHLGPLANQDNHEGHWGDQGNPNSGGQIYLTGILADALTKADILAALRARRFYACEVDPISDRMALEFHANGQPMGSSIVSSAHLALTGTARSLNGVSLFSRAELFRDGVLVRSLVQVGTTISWTFDEALLDGERHFYFVRVTQVDGDHAWSSPIWVTAEVRPAEVEEEVRPVAFALDLLGPNPFRASAPLAIRIPAGSGPSAVSVEVLDTRGRRLGGMEPMLLGPGTHTWSWEEGRGDGPLPAGVYFARLVVDGKTMACRRLVRLP